MRRLFLILIVLILPACSTIELVRDKNTGTIFRDKLKSGQDAPEMVWVPAGKFIMGSMEENENVEDDERDTHLVDIPRPFAIGKYEITVAEFRAFIVSTKHHLDNEAHGGCHAYNKWWYLHEDATWMDPFYQQTENFPVVCVSWNDAVEYTRWLSKQTGKTYRLPTEAEWEYAARGGTDTHYWWGDKGDCSQARCNTYYGEWTKIQAVEVGSYPPNPFGLYDTAGNVWEWVASEYTENYDGSELRQSDKAADEGLRIMRGGSWYTKHRDLRSSNRGARPPVEPWSTVGFRVLREK